MPEPIVSKSAFDTQAQKQSYLLHFCADPYTIEEQNETARHFLRKFVVKCEKRLQEAGITEDNYEQKALQALENGDRELATIIANRYVRQPEWDSQPNRCEFL